MKRLPSFNWLKIKVANKKQVDGLYDDDYQVIGIDPRIGDRKLVKAVIHEILHYLSDSYPKIIKKLSENDVAYYTKEIFKLIRK